MSAPKIPGKGKGKDRNTLCPCNSGKKFKLCHGIEAVAPPLVAAPPSTLLKLDLGCGNTPREGFEGVDIAGTKAMHKVDLFKFPWPFDDNSVEEINLSHFMEHIPAREVEPRDMVIHSENQDRYLGKDMMFAFFDEMYRILKHEGWVHVIVPCARNNRAFQDPTHRRFIVEETFMYFWKEWRSVNVPQYNVRCDFRSDVTQTIPSEIGTRAPEVQGDMIRTRWNVAIDLVAKMKAIKI